MTVTPARIEFHCVNVIGLIRLAYDAQMPNPFVSSDRDPVSGGPGWIKTDNFEIVAKAEGTPSGNAMVGPMLQSILEDRFRLRIRPETRVVPVYELIIAKNGFKKTGFKMEPVAEGFRTPFDALNPVPLDQRCTERGKMVGPKSPLAMEFHGETFGEISAYLRHVLDRPVVDQTGVPGRFDIHLEFAVDFNTPGLGGSQDDPLGESIFAALQKQVSLRLNPSKGPQTFYFIESVEHPSAN